MSDNKNNSSFNDILKSLNENKELENLSNSEINDHSIDDQETIEIEDTPKEEHIYNEETSEFLNEIEHTFDNQENVEVEDTSKEEQDIPNTNGNKIISFLNNKNIYTILIILIFVLSCVIVGKSLYLRNKIDNYEELIISVEKESGDIKIYSDKIDAETDLGKGAANELISCLNNPIKTEDLSEEVKNVINEINDYYNSSDDYFAFVYKDIFTGFTVSYNEDQNIFTASAIKGPTDIYIYEMASQDKIDLDEELTYTSGYYNTGSGLLKNENFNTKYNVRTLLEYSTVYSDNAAHNMLTDRFGRENMYNFWKAKGTSAIFSQSSNWGVLNAKDCSIYMGELYNFYTSDKEFGTAVMNNFINAIPKFISSENNYVIANKSGWSGSVLHDIGIVFADNPYIVVALSNTGATSNYMSYFNTVSDLAYKLHTEYWKYKTNVCENIKQY